MSDSDPVQCPVCGWTGRRGDVGGTDADPECPTCGEPLGAVP